MKYNRPAIAIAFLASVPTLAASEYTLKRELKKFEGECTAVVGEVNHGPNGNSQDDTEFLSCETTEGQMYTVDVPPGWIKKQMKKGELASGKSQLDIGEATIDAQNGKLVRKNKNTPPGLSNKPDKKNKGRNLAVTTGSRTVLAVRVVLDDASPSFSQSQLSESIFGRLGEDQVNLRTQYKGCSHNQLRFVEADERSGINTNIANGAVTITLPGRITAEGDGAIRSAALNELTIQFNSHPFYLANHVMICLPAGTMNGIAYAYINSWLSVYSDQWCTYISSQMHEFGHNLNLGHSNEMGTYKDTSGMMGYSYASSDIPKMCFNAAKSWQLPWYNNRKNQIEKGDSYEGDLVGIVENPEDSSGPPMLIKINTASSIDYYMTFNSAYGFNRHTQEGKNQVMIVTSGAEGSGYSESELVAKLSAGNTYTVPNFEGTGEELTVDVLTIDPYTRKATIFICAGCATATTASPSASPTASPSASPTASPSSSPTASPSSSPTASPSAPSSVTPGCCDPSLDKADGWLLDNGLNRFGDQPQTRYPNGTPLFDPTTGIFVDRCEYLEDKFETRPWCLLLRRTL